MEDLGWRIWDGGCWIWDAGCWIWDVGWRMLDERMLDGGFGEVGLGVQDYGFRLYSPAMGRFLSQDPLTAVYPWYTPYQFAGNTPIQAIDIDGLEPGFSYSPTALNFGSRQGMATARAQNTVNSIFEMSGGMTLYEQIFPRFMSSGNYVIQNTGLQTDSDAADPALRLFTNTDIAFVLNEDNFTNAQISNFLLGNMVTGGGPEHVVFPVNGRASTSMINSGVFTQAIGEFRAINVDFIDGTSSDINNLEATQYSFGLVDLAADLMEEGTVFSVEGFTGSAEIEITYTPGDDFVTATIFNVTSLLSGDYFKDVPTEIPGQSRMRSEGGGSFSNVSKTFQLQIPVGEVFKDRESTNDSN